MITGDNPLTACHVANVLRFVKKTHTVLILDEPAGKTLFEIGLNYDSIK